MKIFPAKNYNLAATLASGQAFRWYPASGNDGAWEGVVGHDHLRLRQLADGIEAEPFTPNPNWRAVEHYLQLNVDIDAITAS